MVGRHRLIIAVLALALIAGTACGGGGSTSTPTSTAPSGTGTSGSTSSAETATSLPATSTATSTRTSAASPAAASPPPATAVATPGSASAAWPTYGRDPQRTETGPVQPALARPARAWASAQLDGDVYGQPLVVGAHVIVATENDSLYALDATTGAVSWHVNFGKPMLGSALPCGDINPSGITGTPVYDPSTGLVYAVAFLQPGRHELYAVDAASGAVKFHRSVDPTGANPLVEQQRAALTLANGKVYLAYGGLWGDCGAYHGWVVGAPAESNGALVSYQVPSGRAAGIWAPAGPTVDPSGDLLVVTGNSFSSSQYDYNNAVIRLSPDLKVVDWFAPSDWLSLNQSDRDLGSLAATLLDGGRVFTAGKSGQGYVLDVAHLGNIGGQVFTAPVCNGAYGGALYRAPTLYVPCLDGITALTVASNGHFSVAWRGPSFAASTPILAYGALWTIDWHSAMLYALDPATGKTRFSAPLGTVMHFASPSAAEGRVFAPAGRTIIAFTPA